MLYIDDREGSRELLEPVARTATPVRSQRLEFGDCSFLGQGPDGEIPIGIEYKTVSDLIQSLQDGRLLGHQLPGMLNSYEVRYLLVEGVVSADVEDSIRYLSERGQWKKHPSSLKYSQLVGWLNSVALLYGVRVVHSSNLLTSAVTVASIYRWWSKPYKDHGASIVVHQPAFLRPLERPTRIQRVASTFPGVGAEKLHAIEAKFASVRDMVNSPPMVWRTIEGIGPKTAAAIEKFLTEKED